MWWSFKKIFGWFFFSRVGYFLWKQLQSEFSQSCFNPKLKEPSSWSSYSKLLPAWLLLLNWTVRNRLVRRWLTCLSWLIINQESSFVQRKAKCERRDPVCLFFLRSFTMISSSFELCVWILYSFELYTEWLGLWVLES